MTAHRKLRLVLMFSLCLFITLGVPSLSLIHAASGDFLPTPQLVPCDGSDAHPCDFKALMELVKRLLNWMIFAATLVTVGLVAWTGFKYLTAGSKPGQLAEAKKRFGTIALGFVLLLGAWLIITTIVNIVVDPNVINSANNPLNK